MMRNLAFVRHGTVLKEWAELLGARLKLQKEKAIRGKGEKRSHLYLFCKKAATRNPQTGPLWYGSAATICHRYVVSYSFMCPVRNYHST
jgi:hypothetical protein